MDSHGHHTQDTIDHLKTHGHRIQFHTANVGKIAKTEGRHHHAAQEIKSAKGQKHHGHLVPLIKAVDREGGAAFQPIAPRLHAVRRLNGVLQRPCDHNGQHRDGNFRPLPQAALRDVTPDAPLRIHRLCHLPLEFGDKPQCHAQHQRQGGDDASKEIDELIGGHHAVKVQKPHHHRDNHRSRAESVENTLQCEGIPCGEIEEDGHSLMAESGIEHRRQ